MEYTVEVIKKFTVFAVVQWNTVISVLFHLASFRSMHKTDHSIYNTHLALAPKCKPRCNVVVELSPLKKNGTERVVPFPFHSRPVVFERVLVKQTGRVKFLMTYTLGELLNGKKQIGGNFQVTNFCKSIQNSTIDFKITVLHPTQIQCLAILHFV